MTITVTIHAAGRGKFLTAINEKPLVTVPTSNPMYGSCRAMVALGYEDGPVEFSYAGSDPIAARIGSIHGGAKLRTEETDKRGLRTVAYRPFDGIAASLTPTVDETPVGDDISITRGRI